MALFLPDGVRIYEASEDQLIHATLKGDAVINAASTVAQGSPNMTVNCAAGTIIAAGAVVAVGANAALAISAADPALPRIDLVHIDMTTGVFAVTTGTPASTPKPPALPANKILSAYVSVAAAALNIQNANITDMRLQGAYPMVAGTLAGRPSATFAKGMSYFATDDTGGTVYRTDGAVWVQIAASVGAITSTNPNFVLNSDFGRRTVFGLAMPETFADGLGYLQRDGGGAPGVAGNILTQGAVNNLISWPKSAVGNFWRDGRASATFKAVSATGLYYLNFRHVDGNNFVRALVNGAGNSLFIRKMIGGTPTDSSAVTQALTVNRWYWVELEAQGTTFIMRFYDTGGTVPGVTKTSSTLLQTVTFVVADAAVAAGDVAIQSDQATGQWGGIAASPGGVYVETWLPESFGENQPAVVGGGCAIGFDEAADAGPLGKQWALRGYIPATGRTDGVVLVENVVVLIPSTTYAFSYYEKASGKSGAGALLRVRVRETDSAGGNIVNNNLDSTDDGAFTRKTVTFTTAATTRKGVIQVIGNDLGTAAGTFVVALPQLELGASTTAWRNAPADDAPIVWGVGATTTLATTASGTFVEIDSRDLAGNFFLPWDAKLTIRLLYSGANSIAGNAAATGYSFDGSNVGPVGRAHSPVAAYNFMVSFEDVRLGSAGKHRIAGLHQTSGGVLSPGVGVATSLFVIATRGK